MQRVVAFDDKVLYVMANRELADVNALVDALPEALGVSYTLDERVEAEEPAAGRFGAGILIGANRSHTI